MSGHSLVKTRIKGGVWEGELTQGDPDGPPPEIEVTLLDQPVPGMTLARDARRPGLWQVRFAIPVDLLSDGVQTFVFVDRTSGATLDAFTMLTGEPLEDDVRAEVDLLRAELDMLKRAFRRHCLETGAV